MSDPWPYKFNVAALEYEDVASWLQNCPAERWCIATLEMIGDLTIEEWRAVKEYEAQLDATKSGDDHQVLDREERAALLQTDSDEAVEVLVKGMPAKVDRRLLNRIAIQGGVNEAGITRENWSAAFARGATGYLVRFRDKNDAIMFKLAMWKRPGVDARP